MFTQAHTHTSHQAVPEQAVNLTATISRKDTDVVLRLSGELSYYSERALNQAIGDALLDGDIDYLILDMEELGHISPAGIGVLLIAKELTRDLGITLVLANTTDYVRQIYKIAHFEQVMPNARGKKTTH